MTELKKPLASMSDRELDEERERRRRLRAAGKRPDAPVTDAERSALARFEARTMASEQDVAKWYAALELRPGASLREVDASFRELSRRYDPEKHAGNKEKHAAATRLVEELRKAHQGLRARLGAYE